MTLTNGNSDQVMTESKSSPLPRTAAEYFAGIGLVRMGLEQAGWHVVFANDFSEKKYAMYRGFFAESNHYLVGDIFDLDPKTIPTTTLATCSFPCVDLSLAGNMSGIGGRHSSAFWGFRNILQAQGEKAPPIILVENVPGWLHSNHGLDFRLTVEALNNIGYQCDVFTLDALRFTPQSRLRVFLIGIRGGQRDLTAAGILTRPPALAPLRLRRGVTENLDLWWGGLSLPDPPPLRHSGLASIIETAQENSAGWWSSDETERHLDMMDSTHRARVESLLHSEHTHYRTFYRRRRSGQLRAEVRDDEVAGCLRTAAGGSGKQFLVEVGKGNLRMRAMTAREYARLQGVDDSKAIVVNGVQALTGFGDAVCVPAIAWIAENALNPLTLFLAHDTESISDGQPLTR